MQLSFCFKVRHGGATHAALTFFKSAKLMFSLIQINTKWKYSMLQMADLDQIQKLLHLSCCSAFLSPLKRSSLSSCAQSLFWIENNDVVYCDRD